MVLILSTVGSIPLAKKISQKLLKTRLIACCNFFPIQASFWWKGKIENSTEVLMILKTQEKNFEQIEHIIQKEGGYETPEVVVVKVAKANRGYSKWLDAQIK